MADELLPREARAAHELGATDARHGSHSALRSGRRQHTLPCDSQLLENAFENNGLAMLITDAARRIIRVNQAFVSTTGYTIVDVIGCDPRILSSGHTPRHVYQQMWHSLDTMGFWQGELWDRRKDGEVFPKWTAITALRDAAGRLTHYVASFVDISKYKATEDRIDFLIHHDPLTGLFNHASLVSRLDQTVLAARRSGSHVAVLCLDINNFGQINVSLGSRTGDELLRQLAQRLVGAVRESDIVARPNGDAFVVVLSDVDGIPAVAQVADKLTQRLSEPYVIADGAVRVAIRLGIAVYPDDGANSQQLLKKAESAAAHAKTRELSVVFFSSEISSVAEQRVALAHELQAAMAHNQLILHYQPQIETASGRVVGLEALVRWQHPERGLLGPDCFVPVAEESGLIAELGSWVLDEACRQLAAWRQAGIANDLRMAVNLSVHQLRTASLIDEIGEALTRHGLKGHDLELEITESAAMHDPTCCGEQLRALRVLGLRLAIDDFGTGYSSLAYLHQLPIDVLKLDRSFVKDIEARQHGAVISKATISLAHSLGLKMVAEGVETADQQDYLAACGCDFLQGYRFGAPLPAALIPDRLGNTPA